MSFYAFVSHPSITMYCLAFFFIILLYGTISTNAQPICYNPTTQSNANPELYLNITCNCGVIDVPDGNVADRWAQADCDNALALFNKNWLSAHQDLPYIQALSAFWNGPQSNVY